MGCLHSFVCMLEWAVSIAAFSYGLAVDSEYSRLIWIAGLIALFTFPLLNELLMCLKYALCKSRLAKCPYRENSDFY